MIVSMMQHDLVDMFILWTANMFELFHALGLGSSESDCMSEGAMVCAEAFSILPDISSLSQLPS